MVKQNYREQGLSGIICFVETHMNGCSHPNYENRLVTTVPRLRASQRHGGARRFLAFSVT
jgi:hypothetical protein